ncbi:MAG: T9SS type A sorting domain-containing protein [Bacteroidales bacterium]|nr:T9SS type A sorting domain-containing protein [Bacteroidales bacterium]
MKKSALFTMIAMMISLAAFSQTKDIIWSDDFEGDWTQNWYVDNGTWEVGIPTSGPNSAYEGQKCAATVLAGNYPAAALTKLITSNNFVIPPADQFPRFTFWEWHSFHQDGNFRDHGIVKITLNGGDDWIELSPNYFSNSSTTWSYSAFDLSDYAGQSVQFAFELDVADTYPYGGDEDVGWYIDLVEIKTGQPVFNNPENWENGIGDWSVTNGSWEVGEPSSGPTAAYEGSNCLATNLAGNYTNSTITQAVSPAFDVPSAGQFPRFTFWEWHSFHQDGNFRDHGLVKIKPVADTVWIELSPNYFSNSSTTWSYSAFDLSDYAGQSVQFAFELDVADTYPYGGDEDVGWYIDLVEIKTGQPVFNNPENWENGIGDWSVTNGSWEVGEPSSGPTAAYEGSNCLATNLAGNYTNSTITQAVSPAFDVPSAGQFPRFTFWEWHSFHQDGNFRDHGLVKIKPVADTVWIELSPNYFSNSSTTWSYSAFDLSDYAGQSVQFAFELDVADTYPYGGDEDVGWYIDLVEIKTGQPVFNNPENWETGIGDWSVTNGTWEVGHPTSGSNSAHSGQKCAATNLKGNYSSNVFTRLVSPPFQVPVAEQNPRIRFWHWFNFSSGDYGIVQIKPTGATEWIDLSSQYINTSGDVWSYPLLGLNDYCGQNVQVAFQLYTDGSGQSSGWYIDDILLDYIAYDDAGVTEILFPVGIIPLDTIMAPKAIVKNFGLNEVTIPVRFSIDPVYSCDKTTTLGYGESDTITFENWDAELAATFVTKCKTFLPEDEKPLNDSLTGTVTVSSGIGPEIYSISPNHGGNTGLVTVEIYGTKFMEGATLKFSRTGYSDIIVDSLRIFYIDSTRISALIDLNGKDLGYYNLVVTNPDNNFITFFNGFIIEEGISYLWSTLICANSLRINIQSTFHISYGNKGNIDEPYVWIAVGIPWNVSCDINVPWSIIHDTTQLDPPSSNDALKVILVKLPDLPVGNFDFLEFKITPTTLGQMPIHFQITSDPSPYYESMYELLDTVSYILGFSINEKSSILSPNYYWDIDWSLSPPPGYILVWNRKEQPQNGWQNHMAVSLGAGYILEIWESPTNLKKRLLLPEDIEKSNGYMGALKPSWWDAQYGETVKTNAEKFYALYGGTNTVYSDGLCTSDFTPEGKLKTNCYFTPHILAPKLRNEGLIYPDQIYNEFAWPARWIWPYNRTTLSKIQGYAEQNGRCKKGFETIQQTTNNINIVGSIDPNLKAGPIGYGEQHHIIPDIPMYYMIHFENLDSATAPAQNIVIRDTLNTNLDWNTLVFDTTSHISSSQTFNAEKGIIEWKFEGINLPPNVNPPEGEGWVLYHVDQKPDLPSGTQITNRASIKFDFNDPMLTETVLNTIDAGYPSSFVSPSATYIGDTTYQITWSGEDDENGSGIRDYTIYVSDNLEAGYQPWERITSATSATFKGDIGKTYYFYSIARDGVGHEESAPMNYDLTLTVSLGTDENSISDPGYLHIYPNPFNNKTTIEFYNPEHSKYQLSIFDIFGRSIYKLENISEDKIEIVKGNLPAGIFIVKLRGDKELFGKMVIQ